MDKWCKIGLQLKSNLELDLDPSIFILNNSLDIKIKN